MNHRWTAFNEQSFLAQLYLGNFAWGLIRDFPRPSLHDQNVMSRLGDQLESVLQLVDPEAVEKTGQLPKTFIQRLRETELNQLQIPARDGGPGLSRYNIFRLLVRAYEHCIPVGFCIGGTLAFGASSLLEALPEGSLRTLILKSSFEGSISGWADTEPEGAANHYPKTTAKPIDNGQFYLINGVKSYINNASIADDLLVSCVIEGDLQNKVRIFLVDCRAKGVESLGVHHMMGLHGQQVAAIRFNNVKVSRENLLDVEEDHWRDNPLIEPLTALGRFYTLFSASVAISKQCLTWSQRSANHRIVNGRPLKEYQAYQRQVSATASELFMLESVALWDLVGTESESILKRWWDLFAAKNIGTMTVARVTDRTVSLMGAQGYDSLQTKKTLDLGLDLNNAEKVYRDARGLRISGGVDFLVDDKTTRQWLYTFYYNPHFTNSRNRQHNTGAVDQRLSQRNNQYLRTIGSSIDRFHDMTLDLRSRFSELKYLAQNQCLMISLGVLGREIFAMPICLARAASSSLEEDQSLAENYCTEAQERVEAEFAKARNLMAELKPQN